MAASSYELTSLTNAPAGRSRRFALPRLRAAALGGGLGLVIVAAGLLVIGLGWNGMAGSGGEVNGAPNLNAQLPWLVSGGILGLALVVFGTAMIVVHNARTDRAQLEAKLDELVRVMERSAVAAVATAPAAASATSAATRSDNTFVAGGTAFHRADCRLVQGRTDLDRVGAAAAADRGLRACRVCKPA